MTSHEIREKLSVFIRQERDATNEILKLINMALEKRAYLDLGFSSMFDWLVKGFGYSNAAAYRRIEAARLLKAVPVISEKLESGEVNLATVSKAQSIIKAQEKVTGQKLSSDVKVQVIQKIENKSVVEVEQTLLDMFPEAAPTIQKEKRVVMNSTTTRHSLNLSQEGTRSLDRLKEVLSHRFPNASDAEIVEHALKELLKRVDPLQKKSKSTRLKILKRSQAACTFQDPVTKQVCGSHFQIQLDHIVPKALGGSDDPENLRPLCRQHNLLMAEKAFGKSWMDRYRKFS